MSVSADDQGKAPDGGAPVELTPVHRRGPAGLRLVHMMLLVFGFALLFWMLKNAQLLLILLVVVALAAAAVGLGVILARRTSAQRESLLWVLAVAAERSLPLAPAALAFSDQFSRVMRWRAQSLAASLDDGATLPEALDGVPGLFSREAETLVRTGWATGTTARALRDAAALRTARTEAWGLIAGRLAYLWALLIAVEGVAGFVLYFITPKFEAIFFDFGIPLPELTILTIRASHALVSWNYGAGALVLVLLQLGTLLLFGLGVLDVFRLDLAPLDWVFRRRHSALIYRSLALAVAGGRPVFEATAVLARRYPSRWVRRRLAAVDAAGRRGDEWVDALADAGLARPNDAAVLASARRAGNLGWALEELAAANERRLGYRLGVAAQLIFPLLVVGMGGLVFVFAVAYFLPLVSLIERLAG